MVSCIMVYLNGGCQGFQGYGFHLSTNHVEILRQIYGLIIVVCLFLQTVIGERTESKPWFMNRQTSWCHKPDDSRRLGTFCHMLSHVATCCHIWHNLSYDISLGGIVALLWKPLLSRPRLEAGESTMRTGRAAVAAAALAHAPPEHNMNTTIETNS